jgi:uncharacterized Fe-S center protein
MFTQMTSSDVFFAHIRAQKKSENLLNKMNKLVKSSGLDRVFDRGDLVAIKLHFGEPGNTSFLRPQFAARMVDIVRKKGGKPFLTDSNTLYIGGRSNAVDHLITAARHGYCAPVVDAPVVIADGLKGNEQVEVKVSLKHCKTVKIGAAAYSADAIIGVAHFKGHGMCGFGGSIKNIGMGFGSRTGKLDMHCDVHPTVKKEMCKGCGLCVENCPSGAVKIGKTASINKRTCIGCGECYVCCPNKAIDPGGYVGKQVLQEKIVEYCYGVLKNKKRKSGFINFLMDVTPDCDCPPWSDKSIVADIGILASKDIVAIDQASVDLVNREVGIDDTRLGKRVAPGTDKFDVIHDVDWRVQLSYAEEIGLGCRSYRLVEV